MKRTLLPLLLVLIVTGCEPRHEQQSVFSESEEELTAVLLLDQSPSFRDFMDHDGQAYEYALDLIMHVFRTSIGAHNKLIIAQIAGPDRRAILWEGTPLEFKRRHAPTAERFRAFLKSHASAGGGSLVHDALIRTTNYLSDKQGKSVLLVLSDMHDEGSQASEDQLTDSLARFGEAGGAVGIYYCHEAYLERWKERLAAAAIKEWTVEGMFVERPALPFSE